MKTLVVIPARWKSTRLPGKPLAIIGDKPMIQHTWEKASQSLADNVIIATDDQRIFEAALNFGAKVMMTSEWGTGTERVIEVQSIMKYDFIINVQGDEPFIDPLDINTVIETVKLNSNSVATLKTNLSEEEYDDPNAVKIITNPNGSVAMFTRSSNYTPSEVVFKHIGIYGYSAYVLDRISEMVPTENSINNSLEQLTWMDHNIPIMSGFTTYKSLGIDTPADLERANNFYK